jgi:hypothetical protein
VDDAAMLAPWHLQAGFRIRATGDLIAGTAKKTTPFSYCAPIQGFMISPGHSRLRRK